MGPERSTADQAIVDELVGNAHGDLARVKAIIAEYPDALDRRATWNETAIEAATQMGNRPIIDFLVGCGAPIDFFTALALGQIQTVERDLETNPQLANARGVHELPALYFAAIGRDVTVSSRLLSAGADVNARAESGAPIHGAVLGGSPDVVRLLLENGADPTLRDYNGRDARTLALETKRPDIAALLDEDGSARRDSS